MTASSPNITIRVPFGGDFIPCRFNYPQTAGKPFLFSIPTSFSGNNWAVLQHVLNGREGKAKVIREVDEGLAAFKVYDISQYIPQFVRNRLGKDRDVPGPNCYQAALAALGFADLEGRHVDPLEAGFFFSRCFEQVQGDPMLGDIRIYYKRYMSPASALGFAASEEPEPALIDIMEHAHDIPPAIGASRVHMFNLEDAAVSSGDNLGFAPEAAEVPLIQPGVHAAVVLLGGLVFQRGGWNEDHVNMIVPATRAMSSIEPISRDPFNPVERAEDDEYVSSAIRMLSPEELAQREDARVIDEELSATIAAYVPVIEHYTSRLFAVSGFQWSKFARNRVDLLAMENLWTILDDIEKILGKKGEGLIRALQSIDGNVAKAYLKLRSLRWQYQVMVNRYDSPGRADSAAKKQRRLRDLYKEHYINPDSKVFRNEIKAHLVMRSVPPKRRTAIIKSITARIKEYNPADLVKGYGASQIDFFGILDMVIQELSSRGGH